MTSAVFDTNVIISGLFWQGPPQALLRLAAQRQLTLLVSEPIVRELDLVLRRTKFKRHLEKQNRSAEKTLAGFRQFVNFVTPLPVPASVIRDPKDLMILECAVGGHADFIVSGDQDLLVLGSYARIPIVTPKEFSDQL